MGPDAALMARSSLSTFEPLHYVEIPWSEGRMKQILRRSFEQTLQRGFVPDSTLDAEAGYCGGITKQDRKRALDEASKTQIILEQICYMTLRDCCG